VESTAVSEVQDERQVELVRGQLAVSHLSERATVDVACRPFSQSAFRDFQLLQQLPQLLNRELTHVTVDGNSERICARHNTQRFDGKRI